jgi:Flp pilus assembly protein TadG
MNKLKRGQSRNQRPDSAQRGANLVEFALILFILALFLIGVADIGRAFFTHIAITNAAREGVRIATRLPQKSGVDGHVTDAVIREAANSGVDLTGGAGLATITIAPQLVLRSVGNPITVTVEYRYTTFIGGLVGLAEVPIKTETAMMLFGSYELPD